jgi:hypothetical protein
MIFDRDHDAQFSLPLIAGARPAVVSTCVRSGKAATRRRHDRP